MKSKRVLSASLRNIMNNKVFYQHPNLMRALGMHETVMEVMVNVLGGGGDSKVPQLAVAPVFSYPSIPLPPCQFHQGVFHEAGELISNI